MKHPQEIRRALESVPGALRDDRDALWERGQDTLQSWAPDDLGDVNERFITSIEDDFDGANRSGGLVPIIELPPDIEGNTSMALIDARTAESVRAEVRITGIEALAWYVPFHQLRYSWGCFISITGLCALADEFLPLRLPASRRLELALHALLRHEATHFAVEYMAAQWELVGGVACYWPARRDLVTPELGFIEIEEKLANAYMLRGFRFPTEATKSAGALELLRAYTRLQPDGYRHGEYFVERGDFSALLSDMSHEYSLCRPSPGIYKAPSRGLDLTVFYPSTTYFDYREMPIYIDYRSRLGVVPSISVRFIPRVENIAETSAFSKRLSSMDVATQRAWRRTKSKLAVSTSLTSLDFKPWDKKQNVFSVRVTDAIRAHLQLTNSERTWSALKIGQHAEMGHG